MPDVVSSYQKKPVNIIVILVIISSAIGIQITFQNLSEEHVGIAAFVLLFSIATILSVTSFIIVKKFLGTSVFGRAYLLFALGIVAYLLGETTYYILDSYFEIDPYPSIADVFFFLWYPLLLAHIIIHVRYFIKKISYKQKIFLIIFPLSVILIYGYVSFVEFEEVNFDFFYGMIFVVGASILLSFTIFCASIFRKGLIGVAWFLLVVGIMLNTVADVWYYYLEVFEAYSDIHPVNIIWYVADFVMIYAFFRIKKDL